jgi:hypothetical protein
MNCNRIRVLRVCLLLVCMGTVLRSPNRVPTKVPTNALNDAPNNAPIPALASALVSEIAIPAGGAQ